MLYNQFDLEEALKEYRKALKIQEREAPNSMTVATSYNNIGLVLKKEFDLEGALKEYRKALTIQDREAPNSMDVATSYNNIGTVLLAQHDLEGALKEFRKALKIQEREAPNSMPVANSRNNDLQGDVEGAGRVQPETSESQEREAPISITEASNVQLKPTTTDNESGVAPSETGPAGFTIPMAIGVSESNVVQRQIQNLVPTDFDGFYSEVITSPWHTLLLYFLLIALPVVLLLRWLS